MLMCALALALAKPMVEPTDPAAVEAEARRLEVEIRSHAADGKSAGVEREYRRLLALGVRIDSSLHVLAADVARNQGDSMKALARLYRVPAGARESDQVLEFKRNLLERYAYVRVSLQPGAKVAAPNLFSPDEVRAAQRMADVVAATGVFIGLVPAGTYTIAGRPYAFTPQTAFQVPPPPGFGPAETSPYQRPPSAPGAPTTVP